jgi:hypothetical protein
MGRSVIVVLRTLNEAVDRIECGVGRIYYLLWNPDGKQIGELSVFVEGILVTNDIAKNCKLIGMDNRDTVTLNPMHMYVVCLKCLVNGTRKQTKQNIQTN